jgi:hypothetical protein
MDDWRKLNSMEFYEKYGFVFVEDAIPENLAVQCTLYSLVKSRQEFSPDLLTDPKVHGVYADTLMESLLHFYGSWVSNVVGKKLWPSYSFYRVFVPGIKEERIRADVSNEYRASLCLGTSAKSKEGDSSWDIYLDVPDEDGKEGRPLRLSPGNMVIYSPLRVDHWREALEGEKGSKYVQVDLNYVDADGPYFPICKFDGRQRLGEPQASIRPEKMDAISRLTLMAHGKQ